MINLIAMIRTFLAVAFLTIAIAFNNYDAAFAGTVQSNTVDSAQQAANEVIKDTGAKEQFGKSKNGNKLIDKAQNEANQKLNKIADEARNGDMSESKKLFLDNMTNKK